MELIGVLGYIENSTFIEFEIKGGKAFDSIGDIVWINSLGTLLLISDFATMEIIDQVTQMFIPGHRRAFKGALRRLGLEMDN